MRSFSAVHFRSLSNNSIGDSGIRHVAEALCSNTSIKTLEYVCCRIFVGRWHGFTATATDTSVVSLAMTREMEQLRVFVEHCA